MQGIEGVAGCPICHVRPAERTVRVENGLFAVEREGCKSCEAELIAQARQELARQMWERKQGMGEGDVAG